jgi:hypothetical protein
MEMGMDYKLRKRLGKYFSGSDSPPDYCAYTSVPYYTPKI